MKKVFVAGSIGLDIIPVFGRNVDGNIFLQGRFNDMNGTRMYLGGCVGNTGIAIHKLGIPTTLYSKIGDDDIGTFIKVLLQREKIKIHLDEVSGVFSSSTVVIAPPGVDRILLHSRGASQTIVADNLDLEELSRNDLFHFGYPTAMRTLYANDGVEFTKLMRKVHGLGLTVSLDTSQPDPNAEPGKADWKRIMTKTLPYVDVFLPSLEELLFMFHRDEFDALSAERGERDIIDVINMERLPALAEELLKLGPSIVGIKMGKRGVYIRTASKDKLAHAGKAVPKDLDDWADRELIRQPYKPDRICSTTGAGDTMIAGFLAALACGYSLEDTLALSQGNAKRCIESFKTTDTILPICELEAWCKKKPPMLEYPSEAGYWTYNAKTRLLIGAKDHHPVEP